jgi:hypothetical protein
MSEHLEIMVHLFHPCHEIDVVYVGTDEYKRTFVDQGYVSLKDIRQAMKVPPEDQENATLRADNERLREACEAARHWLIVNDWLKLDETIAQLEAALAANEGAQDE